MPGMWWEAERYAHYMGWDERDAPLADEEPVPELKPVPPSDETPDMELPF